MHLDLVTASYETVAGLDTAISRQILEDVAAHRRPDTLRLHVPPRVVAFGRRDVAADGYREAVVRASEHGFTPVERLAGGRAAVFHQGTIAFAWAQAVTEPRVGITERFERIAHILEGALTSLGVDATIGELPGEYCPGRYSIHAGSIKVAGVGQRLIRGAAHVGGVIVVEDGGDVRDVLIPVYAALAIPWDPNTAGALNDVADIGVAGALEAVRARFESEYRLVETTLDAGTERRARQRIPDHLPDPAWWAPVG